MGPIQSIKTCLQKYFDFKGRARRSEYWWFFTFVIAMGFIFSFVDSKLFPHPNNKFWTNGNIQIDLFTIGLEEFRESPLRETFGWVVFIPLFAATVRRLHDRAHSMSWLVIPWLTIFGYFLFAAFAGKYLPEFLEQGIVLIPLCALIFLLTIPIKLLKDSERGLNQYGVSPKYNDEASLFD